MKIQAIEIQPGDEINDYFNNKMQVCKVLEYIWIFLIYYIAHIRII